MKGRIAPIIIVVSTLAACGRSVWSPAIPLVERTHQTMGTELRVTVSTSDTARAEDAAAAVFREFDRLDSMMSVWKDASDIVRINASAGGPAVHVLDETREVLHIAKAISTETD